MLIDGKKSCPWKWLILTIATMILFLGVLELVHPYYFTCDDNLDSYIAVYDHAVKSALHGEFATYNFHQFMGIPFLSHGQTGSFNILTYISYGLSYLLLGHRYGVIEFVSILHLTMGAIGMFLLLRKIKCSKLASYLGAVAWGLNSFTVYLGRAWLVVIISAGFLPFLLLSSLNLVEKPCFKTFIAATVWKTLFFYCAGQPQFFTYAIMADCIFTFSYSMIVNKKSFGKIFKLYALSGIAVLFLCLPLLVPMYKEISASANRAGSYSFKDLEDGKEFFGGLLVAVLFPFMSEGGATHIFDVFEFHAGHFGYVLTAALAAGGVLLFRKPKKQEDERTKKVLLAILPPLVLSLLYACSSLFLKLVSYIPIINQFRWPMKAVEYSLIFIIMAAAVLFDVFVKHMIKEKHSDTRRKVLACAVISVNILNFAGLYYLFPPQLRGLNNSAAIPFEEDGVDVIGNDRYVSVFLTLGDSTPFDHNSSMAYNLATIYDMDSYLGYDSIVPTGVSGRDATLQFSYGGIIEHMTESSIDVFRSCGVRWYVVYHGDERYLNREEQEFLPKVRNMLSENGCEIRYSSKDRDFYYDKEAPAVVSGNDQDFLCKIYGNYIRFSTDAAWQGGNVDIHYNYSDKMIATVDGEETDIHVLEDGTGMRITVPEGEHQIKITYKDAFLLNFAVDILIFAAVCTVCVLFARKTKRVKNEPEQADVTAES